MTALISTGAVSDGAAQLASVLETLARPLQQHPAAGNGVVGQSLARGSAGIALWHIERAYADVGAREQVHTWVRAALAEPVSNAQPAGLFGGLPAIAFLLHIAEPVIPDYRTAVEKCDAHLIRLTHRRVDAAMARIDRGDPSGFAEYDLLHGLTGIGQVLLHFLPGTDALARVLTYLVRLTEPLRIDGDLVPGWWVVHDPDSLLPTPGGHANLGLAHGICGPLVLLSTAMRAGITVDGHREAIDTICAQLDRWRRHAETGSWWPYWINRRDYTRRRVDQAGPGRPSWCYGTPGIARALQLAALATRDTARQQVAESALAACLTDEAQLGLVTDLGLCHGWAGLYHTVVRATADADNPALAAHLPRLARRLLQRAAATRPPEHGFLDGAAGTALVLSAVADNGSVDAPRSGWDRCLLIT
jgi:hypothetical protein